MSFLNRFLLNTSNSWQDAGCVAWQHPLPYHPQHLLPQRNTILTESLISSGIPSLSFLINFFFCFAGIHTNRTLATIKMLGMGWLPMLTSSMPFNRQAFSAVGRLQPALKPVLLLRECLDGCSFRLLAFPLCLSGWDFLWWKHHLRFSASKCYITLGSSSTSPLPLPN